jgi:hypothetical protein
MPLKTWVTQPPRPFDSFYYYDTDSRYFVRIRLELGRTGPNPEPCVLAKRNRFIGFVDETKGFDFHEYDRWTVDKNEKIVYRIDEFNSRVLNNQPSTGKKVIDFSLGIGNTHPTFVHHGNAVADPPFRLPENSKGKPVTEGMLNIIAQHMLGRDTTIPLGLSNSTPVQLADAIFKLYHEIITVPVPA